MSVDAQCQLLLDEVVAAGTPDYSTLLPADVRASARRNLEVLPAGPEVGRIANYLLDVPGGRIRLRAYFPKQSPQAVIVYLHGGGWVAGGIEESDGPNRLLTNKSGCIVLAVDYRLAPEFPFPVPVDDSDAALIWAAENLVHSNGRELPLLIAGDSAGATIAGALTVICRDRGSPAIALQILIYPAADAACNTQSFRQYGKGMFPTKDSMNWFWNQYASGDQKFERRASILREENLKNLPPALIQTAEFDPLRDEGEAYGRRLQDANVSVVIDRRIGMIHGYITFAQILDGGRAAMDAIAEFVRASLAR